VPANRQRLTGGLVAGRERAGDQCTDQPLPHLTGARQDPAQREFLTVAGFPIGELWWALKVGPAVRLAGPRGARHGLRVCAAGDARTRWLARSPQVADQPRERCRELEQNEDELQHDEAGLQHRGTSRR